MTLVPTQNNLQPVNEMVSHDTRDLMLALITWGKELHLSNKRFMVSVSKYATIPKYVYESKAVQKIVNKLFCYESIK